MNFLSKAIIIFLISINCYAQSDQVVLDGGIGIFNSGKNSLSETKMITLGIQEDLWGPVKDRFIVGGWWDNTIYGRKSSGLVSGQVGFEVNNNGFLLGFFTGPSLISSPDILLGGYFEFTDDVHLGIQDNKNNYFGFLYRHISDAGLTPINIGRDFLGIELRF